MSDTDVIRGSEDPIQCRGLASLIQIGGSSTPDHCPGLQKRAQLHEATRTQQSSNSRAKYNIPHGPVNTPTCGTPSGLTTDYSHIRKVSDLEISRERRLRFRHGSDGICAFRKDRNYGRSPQEMLRICDVNIQWVNARACDAHYCGGNGKRYGLSLLVFDGRMTRLKLSVAWCITTLGFTNK